MLGWQTTRQPSSPFMPKVQLKLDTVSHKSCFQAKCYMLHVNLLTQIIVTSPIHRHCIEVLASYADAWRMSWSCSIELCVDDNTPRSPILSCTILANYKTTDKMRHLTWVSGWSFSGECLCGQGVVGQWGSAVGTSLPRGLLLLNSRQHSITTCRKSVNTSDWYKCPYRYCLKKEKDGDTLSS